MWAKLKTYIVSWKLLCVKDVRGFLRVCGESRAAEKCPCPFPWQGRSEEQFHCKAQAALMKASPRIQSTECKGENLLWSPFIRQSRTEPDVEQKPVALPQGLTAQKKEILKAKDWNVAVMKVQTPSPPVPSLISIHREMEQQFAPHCCQLYLEHTALCWECWGIKSELTMINMPEFSTTKIKEIFIQ